MAIANKQAPLISFDQMVSFLAWIADNYTSWSDDEYIVAQEEPDTNVYTRRDLVERFLEEWGIKDE